VAGFTKITHDIAGVLTIRTGRETLSQALIDQHYPRQGLTPGVHVLLEVTDNGPGMAPEVKERMFEPFYTTKFPGRGLGLAVVQGILRGHRGVIQVLGEQEAGTTFRLLFPAVSAPEPAPAEAARTPLVPIPPLQGTGVVLVVEDGPLLRRFAGGELRRMGFEPLEAGDGLEALEALEAKRDRIVLILMDLTMPRMDGEETYRRLRRTGVMVPIILCSGFARDEVLRRFRGRGLAGFLAKPYRAEDLDAKIRRGEAALTFPVLNFLEDWLVCHMGLEDQELARHLARRPPLPDGQGRAGTTGIL
jgi:CheY-like chemotaxis protein